MQKRRRHQTGSGNGNGNGTVNGAHCQNKQEEEKICLVNKCPEVCTLLLTHSSEIMNSALHTYIFTKKNYKCIIHRIVNGPNGQNGLHVPKPVVQVIEPDHDQLISWKNMVEILV